MDGWLIEATPPAADGAEPDPQYFAAWIADRDAAVAAVAAQPEAGGAPPKPLEPLSENALRTYGAAPGGVVGVLAVSS